MAFQPEGFQVKQQCSVNYPSRWFSLNIFFDFLTIFYSLLKSFFNIPELLSAIRIVTNVVYHLILFHIIIIIVVVIITKFHFVNIHINTGKLLLKCV